VQVLLWTLAGLVALPVLFLVAVALGPAFLVMLFVVAWAVPVLLLQRAWSHRGRRTRVPPVH